MQINADDNLFGEGQNELSVVRMTSWIYDVVLNERQVQAICHYGDSRLKSEKSSVYVTTYPLPHHNDHHHRRQYIQYTRRSLSLSLSLSPF